MGTRNSTSGKSKAGEELGAASVNRVHKLHSAYLIKINELLIKIYISIFKS